MRLGETVYSLSHRIKANILLGSKLDLDKRPDVFVFNPVPVDYRLVLQDGTVFLGLLDEPGDLGPGYTGHSGYLLWSGPGVMLQYLENVLQHLLTPDERGYRPLSVCFIIAEPEAFVTPGAHPKTLHARLLPGLLYAGYPVIFALPAKGLGPLCVGLTGIAPYFRVLGHLSSLQRLLCDCEPFPRKAKQSQDQVTLPSKSLRLWSPRRIDDSTDVPFLAELAVQAGHE